MIINSQKDLWRKLKLIIRHTFSKALKRRHYKQSLSVYLGEIEIITLLHVVVLKSQYYNINTKKKKKYRFCCIFDVNQ